MLFRSLTVRRIRYADLPLQPCVKNGSAITCRIEFVGPEFDAYPDFGLPAAGYAGMEWADQTKAPDSTASYLKARYSERQWIVEQSATATLPVKAVRLAATPTDSATVILVQEAYTKADGTLGFKTKEDGTADTWWAHVWYGYVGRHYQRFFGKNPELILPCVFVEEDWRVWRFDRWSFAPPPIAAVSSC